MAFPDLHTLTATPLGNEEVAIAADGIRDGRGDKLIAFGRSEPARALHEAIGLAGFVDEYTSQTQWLGAPIYKLEDLPVDAVVVNCVFNTHAWTVQKRLESQKGIHAITYEALRQAYPELVPELDFARSMKADMQAHSDTWAWVFGKLTDDLSRHTLLDVLKFRMTGDARHMREFDVTVDQQYLDPVAPMKAGDIVVDGGAYDGDTAENFLKHQPALKAVHVFEPSLANMEKAKLRLRASDQIVYHLAGLSDRRETVSFSDDVGASSAISQTGTTQIKTDTIDNCLGDARVNFIKLDIEGFELRALKGAAGQIKAHHPTLAICVYHEARDFWEIPDYVLSLRQDYDIYIRHYTQGWSETVMYFVPQDK